MTAPLPAGFRFGEPVDGATVLLNDGPTDAAAGFFGEVESDLTEPALWSRQVLTDGRLRAVVFTEPVTGPGPERFQSVHRIAERVADDVGVGAVEVAVCWLAGRPAVVGADSPAGWRLTGLAVDLDAVVLTDAVLDTPALAKVAVGWTGRGGLLLLASGASGQPPAMAEFSALLAGLTEVTA